MAKKLSAEERLEKAKEEKKAIDLAKLKVKDIITNHRVINGNSKRMFSLKDNQISLIVTSPPYFNAKEYSQWKSLDSYLEDMKKIFKECFRVLRGGRRFCLNISDIPEKGESGVRWISLGSKLLKIAEEVGFELADRIFWFKTPLKGFQYGSLPFPPSPLIADSIEYLYILRKPGKRDYSHVEKNERDASRLSREEYMEYTKQIWSIRRVRLNQNVDGHIAPFPEELPYRCIKLYSFVGETILDPFGGRGTTTKMAIETKRNSVLYEINKDYIDLIKQYLDIEQKKLSEDKIFFENE